MSRVSAVRRIGTTLSAGVREYARNPLLLALVVFLPAYFVGLVSYVTPDAPVPVHLPDGGVVTASLSAVYPVLLTPLVGALVGGFAGFFRTRSGREADGRLTLAGVRPVELALARFGLFAVVACFVTVVSTGVLLATFAPASPTGVALATLLAALTYGVVGALVGTTFGRLPGVYAMLFGPSLDLFVFQNPTTPTDLPTFLLPGHYAAGLAVEAEFGSGIDPAVLGAGVAYFAVLAVLTVVAVNRAVRP